MNSRSPRSTRLKLAFIGFGGVARAFARILCARGDELGRHGVDWQATAIATATRGCVTSREIDLREALAVVERGGHLSEIESAARAGSPLEVAETCDADVLFETTPLDPQAGEPAISHITRALRRGVSVVTANKGPVAFAYRRLASLAHDNGAFFRFEGTVMDGAPVFNLVERCLPGTRVLGFAGVLNSTTNLILTGMASGRSLDDCLEDARRAGIVEADPAHDIDGWDAAVKAVVLANVLMGADLRPPDVRREGIRGVTSQAVLDARSRGRVVRLVARAEGAAGEPVLSVAPEAVPVDSPLGTAGGTSNVLVLETDLMGQLAVLETDPGVEQTAYALLSDLLDVSGRIRDRSR